MPAQPLHVLIDDLLAQYGPAQYARTDLKLKRPVAKADMVENAGGSGSCRYRWRHDRGRANDGRCEVLP